jgi:uncharacterized protein (DUF433 family)
MAIATQKIAYPYISRSPEIRGGIPIVENTRIPVSTLIRTHQLGMDFDEILTQYPVVRPEQFHAAFLYYFDHETEIDDLLEQEEHEPLSDASMVEI